MDENKISFIDFINDVEAGYEPIVTIHWHGRDIEIKRILDLSETLAFVSDVIDACFTSNASTDTPLEETNIVYTPELKKFAIDYMTVAHYTNISLATEETDDEMASTYNFIEHSDIVEQILKVINFEHYKQILESIDSKIKFINDSNILEMTREFAAFNEAIQDFGPALTGIAETFNFDEMENIMGTLSKIQQSNSLKELAVKEMKSNDPDVIRFSNQKGKEKDGSSD